MSHSKGNNTEIKFDKHRGRDGVLLDVGAAHVGSTGLRLGKDGHTVLVPQPSDDPNDPLNWSWFKKHMILFITAFSAFCCDFGSSSGVPCIVPQAVEWHMDPSKVNEAGNLNVLMIGIGGILWIPFSYFWGRGPVLFWTTLSGGLFTLGCTLTTSFETFYALRALMGLTLTICQSLGPAYIQDMFFFHEHARKLGLWACIFMMSPYLGPLCANFIVDGTGDWRPDFWLIFAIICLDLVLIIAFADESWYRRDIIPAEQPPRGHRLVRLVGLWRFQAPNSYFIPVGRSWSRLTTVLVKPIVIPGMAYQAFTFMWAIGINITSSIIFATPTALGGYGYGPKSLGFLYFTPLVAVVLGETVGHFANDWIANRYLRNHQGRFVPEARLVMNFVSIFLMIPGLVLVGQALENHLDISAIIMGWGIFVFGTMLSLVAITAYLLDSYPGAACEVAGFLNFARTIGGFAVGYFQQPWGERQGYGASFGIQAAVVGVALVILVVLYTFGKKMRLRGGIVTF